MPGELPLSEHRMQYRARTEDVILLLAIPQNSRQVVNDPRIHPTRRDNSLSQHGSVMFVI